VKVGKKKSVRGRHIPFAIGSIVVLIGYHGWDSHVFLFVKSTL
jgi:ribosomal protein S6E (S10)